MKRKHKTNPAKNWFTGTSANGSRMSERVEQSTILRRMKNGARREYEKRKTAEQFGALGRKAGKIIGEYISLAFRPKIIRTQPR